MEKTVADDKKHLRAILSDCRAALAPELAAKLSAAVQRRVLASDLYRDARAIVLYAAQQAGHQEVATSLLLVHALGSGRAVFFPRLDPRIDHDHERGRDGVVRRIVAARVRDAGDLVPGAFGILEPPAGAEIAALSALGSASTLICVPGLAFTLQGDRLGRGGGHYDRFLAEVGPEAISVGFAYSFQLLDRIPHEEFDRRLNFIVTESNVHRACEAPLPAPRTRTEEVHPGDVDSSNPGIHRWWRGLIRMGNFAAAHGRR